MGSISREHNGIIVTISASISAGLVSFEDEAAEYLSFALGSGSVTGEAALLRGLVRLGNEVERLETT